MEQVVKFKELWEEPKVKKVGRNRPVELSPKEAEELMRHDSYRRIKGAMRQIGHG